jgi:hypothetical protein
MESIFMKTLIALMIGLFSVHASASSVCTGETFDGALVTIEIDSQAATAKPLGGTVSVESNGNRFGYPIEAGDIQQYFEQDDMSNDRAITGFWIFIKGQNPIFGSYVGANYADQDLRDVLKDPQRVKIESNQLKVWKGPGYGATDQYQFKDFVCSVQW